MNVRLQYDLEFMAGIYYDDRLQLNSYSVNLGLLTKTTDAASTNIAMDRLKYFVHGELANTVFVNQGSTERAEMMQIMGINVTTLPEEPVDQIVGLMLYCKLNAIMETHVTVTDIEVSSEIGDGCWYPHSQNESLGPFNSDGWWNSSEPTQSDRRANKNKRVVKLYNSTNWHDIELSWPVDNEDISDNVVIKSFTPNTDENW